MGIILKTYSQQRKCSAQTAISNRTALAFSKMAVHFAAILAAIKSKLQYSANRRKGTAIVLLAVD